MTTRRHLNLFVKINAQAVANKFVDPAIESWFSDAIEHYVNNNEPVSVFDICLHVITDFVRSHQTAMKDFESSFMYITNFMDIVEKNKTLTPEMHLFVRRYAKQSDLLCIVFEYCGLICPDQNMSTAIYAAGKVGIVNSHAHTDPNKTTKVLMLRNVFEFMIS